MDSETEIKKLEYALETLKRIREIYGHMQNASCDLCWRCAGQIQTLADIAIKMIEK